MRKKLLVSSVIAGLGLAAGAVQAAPISLPAGSPITWKLAVVEQLCAPDSGGGSGNCITPPAPSATAPAALPINPEQNWGLVQLAEIRPGVVGPGQDHTSISVDPGATPIWTGTATQQITGIYYGLTNQACGNPQAVLCSTGGYVDLYWDDSSRPGYTPVSTATALPIYGPGGRTAQDQYAGFTDGTLLVRLQFASGIDPNGAVTETGSAIPLPGTSTGFANGYVEVDRSAGFASTGAWINSLDGNWFTNFPFIPGLPGVPPFEDPNNPSRDGRFKTSYDPYAPWSGGPNPQALGAQANDPAQFFTTPEPASLALMGIGLLGLAFGARRKPAA